jgi:hypothetical protein
MQNAAETTSNPPAVTTEPETADPRLAREQHHATFAALRLPPAAPQ